MSTCWCPITTSVLTSSASTCATSISVVSFFFTSTINVTSVVTYTPYYVSANTLTVTSTSVVTSSASTCASFTTLMDPSTSIVASNGDSLVSACDNICIGMLTPLYNTIINVNLILSELIKENFIHIMSLGLLLQHYNETISDLMGMTLAVLLLVGAMLVLLVIISLVLVIGVYYTRKGVKSRPNSYSTAHKGLQTNVYMYIHIHPYIYTSKHIHMYMLSVYTYLSSKCELLSTSLCVSTCWENIVWAGVCSICVYPFLSFM